MTAGTDDDPDLRPILRALDALRADDPGLWVSSDGLYRIKEADAARMIGRKPRRMRELREEGTGPSFYSIGASPTYAVADVLAWLASRRYSAAA